MSMEEVAGEEGRRGAPIREVASPAPPSPARAPGTWGIRGCCRLAVHAPQDGGLQAPESQCPSPHWPQVH